MAEQDVQKREDLWEHFSLDHLRPSRTNPRRRMDPGGLKELQQSIETKGVLVPLLVRPTREAWVYEIVAGERRYRAAKAAGLKQVPVRIVELTDAEALEVQIIENLQREDVHPIDEGAGYRALLEKAGYDVPAIAKKIGKSISYVYQRLKLADLIPAAQKACLDGELSAGHAILVARLQPGDQKAAIEAMGEEAVYGAMSVRELADWIAQEIYLDLDAAPFSKSDALLLPQAGACNVCPKRTGRNPDLYPDVKKKDTCTDRSCYQTKVAALVAQRRAKLVEQGEQVVEISSSYGSKTAGNIVGPRDWQEVKKGSCASARTGLLVEGHEKGKTLTVCADRDCKKHRGGTYGGYRPSAADNARGKRVAERLKNERARRVRILDAILGKVPPTLKGEDLKLVARAWYRRCWHDTQKALCGRRQWEPRKGAYGQKNYEAPGVAAIAKMPDADVNRLLVEMALVNEVNAGPHDLRPASELQAAARRFRVRVAKPTPRGKRKKGKKPGRSKAVQTSAKKPAARRKRKRQRAKGKGRR